MITRYFPKIIVSVLVIDGAGLLPAPCDSVIESTPRTSPSSTQPLLNVRTKRILKVAGLRFKDLNGNGKLDAYEDWRKTAEERVADLVAQMTLAEKAGMMIDTLNAGCGGTVDSTALEYISNQKMNSISPRLSERF